MNAYELWLKKRPCPKWDVQYNPEQPCSRSCVAFKKWLEQKPQETP